MRDIVDEDRHWLQEQIMELEVDAINLVLEGSAT